MELAHMNRRATAGELAGSIAHELRQPLAAIIASASAGQNWLQRKVPNFDEAKQAFQSIVRDAYRADGVIENVRAMFKKKPSPREPVDINEALEQVLAHVQRRLEIDKINLIKVLASNQPPIVSGRSRAIAAGVFESGHECDRGDGRVEKPFPLSAIANRGR